MKRLAVLSVISLFCLAANLASAGAKDHNASRSNTASTKAQDHNASRSNTSSTKAQDHNASRSNTSSVVAPTGSGGDAKGSAGSKMKKTVKDLKKEKCKSKKCEKDGHVTVLK